MKGPIAGYENLLVSLKLLALEKKALISEGFGR